MMMMMSASRCYLSCTVDPYYIDNHRHSGNHVSLNRRQSRAPQPYVVVDVVMNRIGTGSWYYFKVDIGGKETTCVYKLGKETYV